MATRSTFKDCYETVIHRLGNRTDITDQAKDAVNEAAGVIMRFHSTYFQRIWTANLDSDWPPTIPIPENIQAIKEVSYKYGTGSSAEWKGLVRGHETDIMTAAGVATYPTHFIVVNREIWIIPRVKEPVSILVWAVLDSIKMENDDEVIWFPESLRGAVTTLATSLLWANLGESEKAGTLRNFASMFGDRKTGPDALGQEHASGGVKMRIE